MGNDFDNLMQQIGEEARSEGPESVAELAALHMRFKLASDVLGQRRKLGLSQAALARKCGIPQADISRIERAQGNPTIATIEKLVGALGGGTIEIVWAAP